MELSRLLANLNITFSEKMLKSAVIKHSFANEKSNFASIGDTKNKSFLRKGISGEWSSFLSSKELDHIYHKNREMLTQLGYLEYK